MPDGAGTEYFNQKGSNSIVLLSACDASYSYTLVDIGAMGRRSDGGIFGDSEFGIALESDAMDLPPPRQINDSNNFDFPFVFVGDEAFSLTHYMMRLFPKKGLNTKRRAYNYRLSRARRTIENTFGIMCMKWRIYLRPIDTDVVVAENIVKATVCLHNWLRKADFRCSLHQYITPEMVDRDAGNGQIIEGSWRQDEFGAIRSIPRTGSNNYSRFVNNIREEFCKYFNNEGKLPWQDSYI